MSDSPHGTATVKFSADTAPLARGIASVKSQMSGLASGFGGLFTASRMAWAGLAGGLGLFVREAASAEAGVAALRAALGDAGNDATVVRFADTARALSQVTRFSDDAIIGFQTIAAGAGAAAGEIDGIVQSAMALSAATGGRLSPDMGVRALVFATEEYDALLKRHLPELRSANTASEKQAALAEAVARGQRMLSADSSTVAARFAQIRNAIGETGEAIGASLLPAIKPLAEWLRTAALAAEQLASQNQALIRGIIGVVAASAGLKLVAAAVGLIASPLALVTAGVAALAAAFVNAYAPGKSWAEKMSLALDTVRFAWDNVKSAAGSAISAMVAGIANAISAVEHTVGRLSDLNMQWKRLALERESASIGIGTKMLGVVTWMPRLWAGYFGGTSGEKLPPMWELSPEQAERQALARRNLADYEDLMARTMKPPRSPAEVLADLKALGTAIADGMKELIVPPSAPTLPGLGVPMLPNIPFADEKSKAAQVTTSAGQVVQLAEMYMRITGGASKAGAEAAIKQVADNTRRAVELAEQEARDRQAYLRALDKMGVPNFATFSF